MSAKTRAAVKLIKHFSIAAVASSAVMLTLKFIPVDFIAPAFLISCFGFFMYCMFQIYLVQEQSKEVLSKNTVDSKFE